MKNFMLYILLLLPSILFSVGHSIKYENPFSIVYGGAGTNIYGDYVSIASSVQCIDDDGVCNYNYEGYLFDATTKYENSVSTSIIPLNSSTETLSLPDDIDGKDILYAGLYWQGNITGKDSDDYDTVFSTDGGINGREFISMQDATGNIHNLQADKIWYHDFWGDGTGTNGGHRSFYQGYKDVTSILQNSYTIGVDNNFTVGNIKSTVGSDYGTYFWADDDYAYNGVRIGFWGNWNLIVVYSHPNPLALATQPKAKNITIFQGFDALIPLGDGNVKSVNISLSGFLTPASTPINSKMLFYGSGGEQLLNYDGFKIRDGVTTNYLDVPIEANELTLNPIDNMFNGTITSQGVAINSSISYYPGLDSDEFNVSAAMDTLQTSTDLNLTARNEGGTGDQILPGLIAFSTDVYEPAFCYDYSYKQQASAFTEDNDGFTDPRIVGDVVASQAIEVGLFVRNYITSDLVVTDMVLDIVDINTSQASYIEDTTKLAFNSTAAVDEAVTTDIEGSYIHDIDIGTVQQNDYFYVYYDLNPIVNDINMSINAVAKYNLTVNGEVIPYELKLGSGIPLCTSSNFYYAPESGIYNVVHSDYYNYDISGSNRYYNLPTQVTQRDDNFKVLYLDPADESHNELLEVHPSAVVAVEMIDISAFHDTYASCNEISSSISEKEWIILDENVTSVPYSGNTNMARRNAAFRVSYNIADGNGSVYYETKDNNGNNTSLNWTEEWTGEDCATDMVTNGLGNDNKTASYCNSTSSTYSVTDCMECIYGIHTEFICSRDNFSIRPESFMIKIDDQNQSNPSQKVRISDNVSGVVGAVNIKTDLAAGYEYHLEVNATNYTSNDSSLGYTKSFSTVSEYYGDIVEYKWSPSDPLVDCNAPDNIPIYFRMVDGKVDLNTSLNNVGEYTLHMKDTTWTTVDSNPIYMQHHTGAYFIDASVTLDCIYDSSITKATDAPSVALNPQNGCFISSEHNSSGTSLQYNSYNIESHPYEFDMNTTVIASHGLNNSSVFSEDTFIYMTDMDKDEKMSFHLNGSISAKGENGTTLSNFVGKCYAKPVSLSLTKSAISGTTDYRFRYHNADIKENDINGTMNGLVGSIDLNSSDFNKSNNGVVNTIVNLNLDRNVTTVLNPEKISFTLYSAECTDDINDCSMNADMLISKKSYGEKVLDLNITHLYGRTHASRQRYEVDVDGEGHDVNIYYEAYCFGTIGTAPNTNTCDKNLLPQKLLSKRTDDIRWYINESHSLNEGTLGVVTQRGANDINATAVSIAPIAVSTLRYNASQGYPYKATMENNASRWLIYDPDNINAEKNNFPVEFDKASLGWSGEHNTSVTTKGVGAVKSNRRTMW